MQIRYELGVGVILLFPQSEVKVALGVIKAINKISPADFLHEAINDIEKDLKPKQLPAVNYFHLCEICHRDLDERSENVLHLVTESNDKWVHNLCPPLKANRPV